MSSYTCLSISKFQIIKLQDVIRYLKASVKKCLKKRREKSILEKELGRETDRGENERKREGGERGMGDDREIERERCGGG